MTYSVLAYHLTDSLKLKKFSLLFPNTAQDASAQRIIYQLAEDSFCLVYNFGSVVFFNVEEKRREEYLTQIKSTLDQETVLVTSDDFLVEVDPQKPKSVDFTQLTVKKLTKPMVELVTLILAQSTALEYFENEVFLVLNQLEAISISASRKKIFGVSTKEIFPIMEKMMRIKRKLIGSVFLLEKPESTWTSKEMDELHEQTAAMFELKDRFKNLDYELKTLQEDMSLLTSLTSTRQMLILEVAIVALFILDLVLFGFEVFSK